MLRALAGAANALRLYPPTSQLPAEAVARFVELASETTKALDYIRVVVEPTHFSWSEYSLGRDNAQMEALAQALYSQQVGQLVIAQGVHPEEVHSFIACIDRDKAEIKDAGGITRALVDAGVTNLAVVEMTVRASREEGLKGVDLLAAPLEEIGTAVADAAERWAQASESGEAHDEAEDSLAALAAATKEIAASRITDALLRLDEQTRLRVLANARKRDKSGKQMDGMLKVVGQMSPAALARLLTLLAGDSGESPRSLLPELDLPPEAMQLMTMMLSPSPQSEEQRGVPPVPDLQGIAAVVAVPDEDDEAELERMIEVARPDMAAGRGLATACYVAISHPDADSVQAVGDALPSALRNGSFAQVGDALELLEGYGMRPDLVDSVARARRSLADPELLADACAVADASVPPETLASVVVAAGDVGYDVFVSCWSGGDAEKREHLRPVLAQLGDRLVVAAGKVARGSSGARAREAVALLGQLGDSRAIPQLGQVARHEDKGIRLAAIASLAEIGGAEAGRVLADLLDDADRETRLAAAQEIGRHGVREAIPGLIRAVEKYHLVERDADFKTEVIRSMSSLKATDAVPALKRLVSRGWAFGAGNKTVREAARQAISAIGQA